MVEMKTTSNGNKLKILKVEYFRNNLSDLPQILDYVSGELLENSKEISSVDLLSPAFPVFLDVYAPQGLGLSLIDSVPGV